MPDSDSEYLSDIIFQRTRKEQLQFELGFAPLLATVVGLMRPTGIQGSIIVAAVVGLVAIAFLRWLTFTGRFANEEFFVEQTVRPVELCAIIGVVQVFQYTATTIDLAPVAELTTLLAVLGALVFVVFVEFVFRTYRLGWGSLFYLRCQNGMEEAGNPDSVQDALKHVESGGTMVTLLIILVLSRMYMEIAYYVLQDALPDRRDKYIDELHQFVQEVDDLKDGGSRDWGIVGTFALSSIVVVPVLAGIAWGLSLIVGAVGSLVLALVTMRVTKHVVGFGYIAFGTLRFDQFITTNTRSIMLLTAYTAIIHQLFFSPTIL